MKTSLLVMSVLLLAPANTIAGPVTPAPEATRVASSRDPFTVDRRLRKNLDFWVKIYSQYDTKQGLIHDAKHVDIIYEVLDLSGVSSGSGGSGKAIREAKKRWKALLMSVHYKQKQPEKMNEDERYAFNLFKHVDEPNKFMAAAHRKRMRFQLGQKDRFIEGLRMSGRYLPIMEKIFRDFGLPVQLTRLPFVESSFNIRARSKVGASGIWQFMRSTGRFFLTINDAIDERNDPIRATEAAAKLLRMNHDSLRQWPLAVTAYNHGRKGMMRAVRKVGSEDLEELVGSYRSQTFGFASSNFFTELLAAIEVEKSSEKYFGKLERDPLLQYTEVTMPDFVDLRELVTLLKLDLDDVRDLNPAFLDTIYAGKRLIPKGYKLRLPLKPGTSKEMTAKLFLAGYEQIPDTFKFTSQDRARKKRPKNHKEKLPKYDKKTQQM